MNTAKQLFSLALAAVLSGVALVAAPIAFASESGSNTIVDVAQDAGTFTTLVAALEATGLDETLMGEGPFTVFAPTDEAFAQLPKGVVNSLVKRNTDQLSSILQYHVVSGSVDAATVVGLDSATTVLGSDVDISVLDGDVMINGARVTTTDITTDNGIIHVIDSVLVPASVTVPPAKTIRPKVRKRTMKKLKLNWNDVDGADAYQIRVKRPNGKVVMKKRVTRSRGAVTGLKAGKKYNVQVRAITGDVKGIWSKPTNVRTKKMRMNIVDTAVSAGSFNTLAAALGATGLDEVLTGDGPFTVFAPTDAAFEKLPEGTVEALLADTDALSDILLYHVAAGKYNANKVLGYESLTTVEGSDVEISVNNDKAYINDAQIVTTDIKTSNGIIHVIDSVLIPDTE